MDRDGGGDAYDAWSADTSPSSAGSEAPWCVPGAGFAPAPRPLTPEVAALSAAVDAVAAQAASGLAESTALLLRLTQRLHGLALRELAEVDRTGDHGRGSSVPVPLSSWLQAQLHVGDDAARGTVRLARRLDDELPAVRDALVAGETTLDHVRAVHAGTGGLDADLVRAAQRPLAELASTAEPAVVRRELRERAEAIEPRLGEDAARRQHQRRGLTVSRLDGYGVHVTGRLGEEDGALLLLGLTTAVQAERATSGSDDDRTTQQRQMDVVVGWARAALAEGGSGGPSDAHAVRTSFLVGCTPEQLAAAQALVPMTRDEQLDLLTGRRPVRPASLTDLPGSATLTLPALRRLSCDATITLVVQELVAEHRAGRPECTAACCRPGAWAAGHGEATARDEHGCGCPECSVEDGHWWSAPRVAPLYVGRSSRTVSGQQFKALVARDRHCVVKGCTRPPRDCEGHHVLHWLLGGLTDLDNLVLLCHRHHHLHHDEGRDLQTWDGRWMTATGWADDPPGLLAA